MMYSIDCCCNFTRCLYGTRRTTQSVPMTVVGRNPLLILPLYHLSAGMPDDDGQSHFSSVSQEDMRATASPLKYSDPNEELRLQVSFRTFDTKFFLGSYDCLQPIRPDSETTKPDYFPL